jgi:hypothetical protein
MRALNVQPGHYHLDPLKASFERQICDLGEWLHEPDGGFTNWICPGEFARKNCRKLSTRWSIHRQIYFLLLTQFQIFY